MAKLIWKERSALHYVKRLERYGADVPQSGVSLQGICEFKLLHFSARSSPVSVGKTVRAVFGVAPPPPQMVAAGQGALLLWTGPDQFLVITASTTPSTDLRKKFAKTAAISDQTDSRVLVKLHGPKSRDTLAKMLSVDLHPNVFTLGKTAVTSMAHCNINLWKAEGDHFFILVPASFAEFLWYALLDHAGEYGVDMHETAPAVEAGLFSDKPKKTRIRK